MLDSYPGNLACLAELSAVRVFSLFPQTIGWREYSRIVSQFKRNVEINRNSAFQIWRAPASVRRPSMNVSAFEMFPDELAGCRSVAVLHTHKHNSINSQKFGYNFVYALLPLQKLRQASFSLRIDTMKTSDIFFLFFFAFLLLVILRCVCGRRCGKVESGKDDLMW